MNNEPTLKARIDGESQQVPVSEIDDSTLHWYRDKCKSANLKQIAIDELKRRSDDGPPDGTANDSGNAARSAPQSKALATSSVAIDLKTGNPAAVTAWFHANEDQFNIISPSTVVQSLPEGFEVAISTIRVNPNPGGGDVYVTDSGGLALTGSTLARVSQAAGITWDVPNCRRIDDHRDPNYCVYRVVGSWRLFDGTQITECATRRNDLREGSVNARRMSEKNLMKQREFVEEMAETKAKNRLIRRLGLKAGYTPTEIAKPFAVARLMFTGHSEDPVLRRQFALLKAQDAIRGQSALFGPMTKPAPEAPALDTVGEYEDAVCDDGEYPGVDDGEY